MGLLHLIHGRPWAVQINLLLSWGKKKKFTLGIRFTCWERSCLFLFTVIDSASQRWLMHTLKGLGGTINSLLVTTDPVQSKLRSKKSFPLIPVPKLHYTECTLFPGKLMEGGVWCIKEPSRGDTLEVCLQKNNSINWHPNTSDNCILWLFHICLPSFFFQKDARKEMRSVSKICDKPCFSTSPQSRHKIYCSKMKKRKTP